MKTSLSRRSVLGGAAAAVVGWSTATTSWATAADVSAGHARSVAPVPPLDGTLHTSDAGLEGFRHDFGRLRDSSPWAVLRPGSDRDVVAMIDYARANGLKVAVNGQSGTGEDVESHSVYGQAAVPTGGISIDARAMSRIVAVESGSAVVEAGATWAEVTEAALRTGQAPPAFPDYMHLSVGGTISVGGVGGTLHQHGMMCDNVLSMDVVTGTGERLTVSPRRHRDLFLSALSGGGQTCVILRVTVRLVEAPERIVVYKAEYDDLRTYVRDSVAIMSLGSFDVQAGEMFRTPDGSAWGYRMELGLGYSGGSTGNREARALRRIRRSSARGTTEDLAYREYLFRLDAYESYLKAAGYWYGQKPWLSLFLPGSKSQEFMERVESELTADDLGGGFLLFYPYWTRKVTRPLAVQPDERVGFLFDLLRFPSPGYGSVDGMLQQNRKLYDLAVSLGATRYLVGAVPDMGPREWRRHFGTEWSRLRDAKRRYDPAGVLTPGQGFFS